jgi:hypothetical protein
MDIRVKIQFNVPIILGFQLKIGRKINDKEIQSLIQLYQNPCNNVKMPMRLATLCV